MNSNMKNTIVVTADIIIGVYLAIAVTALNSPDEKASVCPEVKIDIAEPRGEGFMNTAEVKHLLTSQNLYPTAQPPELISTRKMEEALEKSPFVDKAECYKTQSGHVCISLRQRLPVMHVMADNGENYYIDNHCEILPASNMTSNQIIATGRINQSYARQILAPIANKIHDNRFWQSQIVQLNILGDGSIEMVPRVGDHIVHLGGPTDIDQKLNRLRKFYKHGLSQAGWNKYERISVEFGNQIICKKKLRRSF